MDRILTKSFGIIRFVASLFFVTLSIIITAIGITSSQLWVWLLSGAAFGIMITPFPRDFIRLKWTVSIALIILSVLV